MMHIHIILVAGLIAIFTDFWGVLVNLITNPCWSVGYIVPFIVQILLPVICILLRANLNKIIMFQDVIIICVTPATIVSLPFIFSDLQKLVSPSAKYNIYYCCNIIGLIINTFIWILGGSLGFFIYNRTH